MARPSDRDQRFAHFCRTGDPGALGEVFDATARELLHVAIWLMRHRADAEDLLQRTFLAAIELRARFTAGQPVLPWLMGLLAIEARHLRRERERKRATAPPPPARDPEAEAAALELDAAVRAASDELGEPYRFVLSMHLQQGLNAKEIAERLQRPAGTVRTQLVRALELLRKKLPGGFVAGFAALVPTATTVPASVRAAVMHAAKHALPVAAAAATATSMTLGVTMSKKVAALAAVVLLLLFSAVAEPWLWRDGESAPLASVTTAAVAVTTPAAGSTPPAAPPQRTELEGSPPAAGPTTGSLVVHVGWHEAPTAGVGIALAPARGCATLHERLGITDAAGECRFDDLSPGDYTATAAFGYGNRGSASVAAGATVDLQMQAEAVVTVRGLVTDEFDRPIEGADIWLSDESSWYRGYVVAHSDAAGCFRFAASRMHYLAARKAGCVPSYMRDVVAREARELDFTLQLRGAGGAVRGRVVDAQLLPVAGARVLVGDERVHGAPGMRGMNGERTPRGVTVTTDAEGRFVMDGIEPGPTDLRAWAEGAAPCSSGVVVEAHRIASVEIMLQAAATLTGTVRDAHGQPIAGATVACGERFDFGYVDGESGPDGRYVLGNLPAGEFEVVAKSGDELHATTRIMLQNGVTHTWDPVLGAGRVLRGIVLDGTGQPLVGMYVQREPWMARDQGATSATTDAEGRFVFRDVARDAVHMLRVHGSVPETLRAVAMAKGEDEVTIHLADSDLPTASVLLRLVDALGQPVEGQVIHGRPGGNEGIGLQQVAAGSFASGDLRPGTLWLYVVTTDMKLPLPPVVLQPHESKDLGCVVVPVPAKLRVQARDANDRPLGSGWVDLVDAAGQSCVINGPQFEHGELELVVPPGSWTAVVNSTGVSAAATVLLLPGSTRDLSIVMPPCRDVPIELIAEACGFPHVLVKGRDGHVQWAGCVPPQRDGSMTYTLHLPPGDYTFAACGPGESCGIAEATVPVDGAAGVVRIALRAATR